MEADSAGPERPFTCELCPKKYLRKNNMQDHVLMEHPDSVQASEIIEYKARNGRCKTTLIIECDICAKRFRYQSDMKNHYESHFRPRGRGAKISIMGSPRGGDTTPNSASKSTPPVPAVVAATLAATTPSSAFKAMTPGRGAPGVLRGPYQPRKSRPCLYCGRVFQDKEELQRHELWEAAEFEREALEFEMDVGGGLRNGSYNNRVIQSDFESQSERFQQLIDRTDEEFGDESCSNGYHSPTPAAASRIVPRGAPPVYMNGGGHELQQGQHQVQQRSPLVASHNIQYNHTSQYTSLDPGGPVTGEPPPPAHEGDQLVAQHGFLPPPPPLPVPQFAAQGCHNRGASDAEFPDPNEERTYTRLTSKDESHTCTSLLQVNGMSPSREVLDLSLPKPAQLPPSDGEEDDSSRKMDVDSSGGAGVVLVLDSSSNGIIKSETSSSSEEEMELTVGGELQQQVKEEEEQQLLTTDHSAEEMVFFEPASMPSMPEANLLATTATGQEVKVDVEESSLTFEEDWKAATTTTTLNGAAYSQLMEDDEDGVDDEEDEEEDGDASSSSFRRRQRRSPPARQSPVQFEDPNRLDCKFCGMIFEAPHVRQFHESSHDEEQEEYDGELTRLFCGYCAKTFKKAQYRILHEKGHTGELAVCCAYCDRRFRWESELRSHNRIFCTPERPAKPLGFNKKSSTPKEAAKPAATPSPAVIDGGKTTTRLAVPPTSNGSQRSEREDQWVSHPNLPAGWRQRSRPRPDGGGQPYFVYMAPEGQIFHSRRAVLTHMEASGGYSREEHRRMKLHCKSGPRGRRPKSLLDADELEEEDSNSRDADTLTTMMDTSGSNLDYPDSSSNNHQSSSLDTSVDEEDEEGGGEVEGKRHKSRMSSERKLLPKRRANNKA